MLARIEHDHASAVGGFWVRPDGTSIPVKDPCEHWSTLSARFAEEGLCGSGGVYVEAYLRGWVRITYCEREQFGASFFPRASVTALREMLKIMRHNAAAMPKVFVEERPIIGWENENAWVGEVAKVAPQLSAHMLARAKAAKVAEAYRQHCQPAYAFDVVA